MSMAKEHGVTRVIILDDKGRPGGAGMRDRLGIAPDQGSAPGEECGAV